MPPSANLDTFRRVLHRSKNIVAIAGAGLSAASGIPTFRGDGGLWRSYDAMQLATPEAFQENPSRVWQFYHMRREKALKAQPNAAHLALATLALPERLRVIAPHATFTLITQNVDGLSARALEDVCKVEGITPESSLKASSLFEMHGHLFETICTVCDDRMANHDSPICPALAGTELIMEQHAKEPEIPMDDLPRCQKPGCGGLLRPGVVWFGEVPHHLQEIEQVIDTADLGLVVGTSSTVYPAAQYAWEIKARGGKVAVFNIARSDGDNDADFLFLGPCEERLPFALFGVNM
ncbi:DHS-like NAD/FAD-binding domain-containing protein [Sparassis latifolia]